MSPEQFQNIIESNNAKHFAVYDELRRLLSEVSRQLTALQTEMSFRVGNIEEHLKKLNGRVGKIEEWKHGFELDQAKEGFVVSRLQTLDERRSEESQHRRRYLMSAGIGALISLGLMVIGKYIL